MGNMKKIIVITLLLASVLTVFSCREKSYDVAVPQLITVSSGADIAFKAIGGEGDIEVNATSGQLQVTTDQADWCHLTLNGNKIHVVTDANDGLESRYAVLNMQAGEATGKTIVHQYGIILREFEGAVDQLVKNKATDIVLPYDANETVIVANSDADWLTLDCKPEQLVIHVGENETKEYREAKVTWAFGQMTDSFVITQFDAKDAGLLGSWSWASTNASNNRSFPMTAALSQDEDGTVKMNLVYSTYGNWTFDVKVGKAIQIPLGAYLGEYKTSSITRYVYALAAAGTAGTTYANAVHEGSFNLMLSKDATSGKWTATAENPDLDGKNFRLEMWNTETPEGNSASRIALKNIQMTQN